jgi:hypothetical protein
MLVGRDGIKGYHIYCVSHPDTVTLIWLIQVIYPYHH